MRNGAIGQEHGSETRDSKHILEMLMHGLLWLPEPLDMLSDPSFPRIRIIIKDRIAFVVLSCRRAH